MSKQEESWGKRAEQYALQNNSNPKSQGSFFTTLISEQKVKYDTKHLKTHDTHPPLPQTHIDTFQCLECKASKDVLPSHPIYWDIGAQKAFVCIGANNIYEDEA